MATEKEHTMQMKDTGERLIVNGNFPNEPMYLRHIAAYIFAKNFVAGKVVLDSGSGSGYGTYYLATNGAAKVTGVDVSEEATVYSRSRYKSSNLTFETSDVSNLKYANDTFDLVTSFQVIEHLKDPDKFLEETKRVLKKSGIAIISTPNKQTYSPGTSQPENPFHEREFYYDDFKKLMEVHFGEVKILGLSQSARAETATKQLEHGLYAKMEKLAERLKVTGVFKKITPIQLRQLISPAHRRGINTSDFCFEEVNPEHSIDLLSVCKKT